MIIRFKGFIWEGVYFPAENDKPPFIISVLQSLSWGTGTRVGRQRVLGATSPTPNWLKDICARGWVEKRTEKKKKEKKKETKNKKQKKK